MKSFKGVNYNYSLKFCEYSILFIEICGVFICSFYTTRLDAHPHPSYKFVLHNFDLIFVSIKYSELRMDRFMRRLKDSHIGENIVAFLTQPTV